MSQDGLDISHHADNTLKSFCKWQATINPETDDHPNHHDVAILLTRFVIFFFLEFSTRSGLLGRIILI